MHKFQINACLSATSVCYSYLIVSMGKITWYLQHHFPSYDTPDLEWEWLQYAHFCVNHTMSATLVCVLKMDSFVEHWHGND